MADSDKNKRDVAAALAALAGGAIPSETETPSGGIPSESTVFSPPPPAAPPQLPAAAPSETNRDRSSAPAPRSQPRAALPTAPSPRPEAPANLLPKNLPLPSAFPPPARIRPARQDGEAPKARPAMPQRPIAAPVVVPPPPSADRRSLSLLAPVPSPHSKTFPG